MRADNVQKDKPPTLHRCTQATHILEEIEFRLSSLYDRYRNKNNDTAMLTVRFV